MNSRMKALLGVSALALVSGAAPLVPALLVPMADTFGSAATPLVADAAAQESGEGEGTTECPTEEGSGEEGGEGEEGGSAECPPPEGEGGEDGEGEGG